MLPAFTQLPKKKSPAAPVATNFERRPGSEHRMSGASRWEEWLEKTANAPSRLSRFEEPCTWILSRRWSAGFSRRSWAVCRVVACSFDV
jgi:hypothetical protein